MSESMDRKAERPFAAALWLGVGDFVSVERWDKTERQPNRVGTPATVTQLETGEYCETGIMVTVIGTSGKTLRLDMNWLHPYSPNGELNDRRNQSES